MEFRELRSLILISELGSIAKAAAKLHLSAPAVHKQIKALEREVGVPLYQKEGRNLHPTQAAELMLPYCRDLLAQHDAALRAVEEWRGLKRGVVRIGAGPTISSYILPGMLKRFRRSRPGIDLFVETGDSVTLSEQLRNGGIDLALLVSSQMPAEPRFKVEASWDVEYVLVSNLSPIPKHCSVVELKKFPFILFRKGSRIENLIDRYFAEVRFQPTVVMTFDNAEAIKAMIRTGFGISMLPYWIVDADIRKGALRMIRQKERPLISTIDLWSHQRTYMPPPVSAFAQMARGFECRNPKLRSAGAGV